MKKEKLEFVLIAFAIYGSAIAWVIFIHSL
jgi:hypothetical protein